MSATIRAAAAADAHALSALLRTYVCEALSAEWGGREDTLRTSLETGTVKILLAVTGERLIGFAASLEDYDLHHCVRGIRVIDLYVVREWRGRSIGALLLTHVAAHAVASDFAYIRGEAIDDDASRHLFDRVAIRSGDSFNVSGKALRLLAGLRDCRPRDIVTSLPKKDMNHED